MQGMLFDLDETLIDRSRAIDAFTAALWAAYFKGSDVTLATLVRWVQGIDQHGYAPREQFFNQLWQRYSDLLPDQQAVEKLFHEQVWETPILVEGVIACLKQLQNDGIALGIVTNGSTRAQSAKIKHSGLADYFTAVVISESFGVKKPDPSIYRAATNQMQVVPEDCWFVGDHPVNDIWGSKQVGFRAAWIHLDRGWNAPVDPCYDLKGASFIETMSRIRLQ